VILLIRSMTNRLSEQSTRGVDPQSGTEDPGTRVTIDGLNTQLAEVSSSLAEKVVMLERDKDILGSRVNASHRRVHTLCGS